MRYLHYIFYCIFLGGGGGNILIFIVLNNVFIIGKLFSVKFIYVIISLICCTYIFVKDVYYSGEK